MQLKLKTLQDVVKTTMKEERVFSDLCEDIVRVLGKTSLISSNHDKTASEANDRLDVLESTGRFPRQGSFKVSVLMGAANSKTASVRKLAARLLPVKHAVKLVRDADASVRASAARRLPHSIVKEAVKQFPGDEHLRSIARAKRLLEAGLPDAKVVEEPFDIHGEDPLGDAVKTPPGEDLPDSWYERLARKLCKEYGSNLEGQWEEILATRVASSTYATSGNKLDRDKLLKAIYAFLEERDDEVLGENTLRTIIKNLRRDSVLEETAFMPVIDEVDTDPVRGLVESNLSPAEYVVAAENLFNIKKSAVPAGIKKYRIGEGYNCETMVPVVGRLPAGSVQNVVTERALDSYVTHWNSQQALRGEPYVLSWGPHAESDSKVGFSLVLK